MIESARGRALAAVNTALIELYWNVGAYISRQLASAAWGEGVVERLAKFIAARHPEIKGFTRASLFRMRQFYEVYEGKPKIAALLRQLPWTPGSLLLSGSFLISQESRIAKRQRRCVAKPRVAVGYPGCACHEEHNPNGVVVCLRTQPEPFPIVAPAVRQWVVGTVGGGRIPRFDAHAAGRCNPFGVVTASCRHPRVGAVRQPWAGGQNAFGVIRPVRLPCSVHSKLHEFYQLAAPVRTVNARPTAKPRKPH